MRATIVESLDLSPSIRMTQDEFEALLHDTSKQINEPISWTENPAHAPTVEFRVSVESEEGYPIFVKGSYNKLIRALTYVLIHRQFGRIYGLDLGKDHRNPDGQRVGETHKHRWDEALRDKQAYCPPDITEPATNPVGVWRQFCQEARITHNGILHEPPPQQLELF